MEFEVRVEGGIESCFVSLPLTLIQTLQSGYLPPILAIELRSDARLWHVAWCGSASSFPSAIEATLVTIEPLTEDDWEILELNSELAETAILKQVICLILCLPIYVSMCAFKSFPAAEALVAFFTVSAIFSPTIVETCFLSAGIKDSYPP
ncbi:hypothetical protein BUALT_Bualt08G0113200 [Buddleja alternifolia]|uniref:Peroxisomal ATPase PEX1 N-terminal C-lobe domain-containing protein n=1 Tax=Buddleja alternifolia TaxID=168488 RepID=A0AAV6X5X2_9LAMI|nr:hypothetical protein BUALT_Bualt08G0113200 [Buddleja alternifolia]